MAPSNLYLRVTPESTIHFPATLHTGSSVVLRLQNIVTGSVAFKVKTTAPKNYLVRPSTGVIPEGAEQEVQIVLQALSADPPASTDRFLIQAIPTDTTDGSLPKDFWTVVSKSSLQDQRLAVVFQKPSQSEDASSSLDQGSHILGHPSSDAQLSGSVAAMAPPPGSGIGGQLPDGSRRLSPSATPQGPPPYQSVGHGGDSDSKYTELVQYCLAVEKQKNHSQKEVETLRNQLQSLLNQRNSEKGQHPPPAGYACKECGAKFDASSSSPRRMPANSLLGSVRAGFGTTNVSSPQFPGGLATQQFELWHVIAIVVAVVVALKVINFF